MSRCFSYPPPGYVKEEAKIELPEKEKEQTKERREKKREKKEKSREHQSTDKKKRKREKRHDDQRSQGESAKKRDSDSENVEKSGLTEEQGVPNYDQNSPDTDSTQKIAKIIHLSATETAPKEKTGSLIIRLPSIKRKHAQTPCDDGPSTSGRPSEAIPTTSFRAEATLQTKKEASLSYLDRIESHYNDLIVNWRPPPLQFECSEPEDLGWLFGSKKQRNEQALKRCSGSELSSNDKVIAPSWPPRATYLPEAGIYVLPYTVPF
ncbi:hypothetical protein QJS10_CPA01g00383 [Acorus calamus]|uniref:Uncharacterized protein n=1 Tax=Acorus calamus TaxID=4465 RepID=A0AAV9FU05_ACOCL|nr:hypothetical protein QJS10_CPA01g00383 [Acorus calamus]